MVVVKKVIFVRYYPQRDLYNRWFQHFVNIAGAAAYILSHTDFDGGESGHKVLVFFADAEDSLLIDRNSINAVDEDLDTWMNEMFTSIDGLGNMPPQSTQ